MNRYFIFIALLFSSCGFGLLPRSKSFFNLSELIDMAGYNREYIIKMVIKKGGSIDSSQDYSQNGLAVNKYYFGVLDKTDNFGESITSFNEPGSFVYEIKNDEFSIELFKEKNKMTLSTFPKDIVDSMEVNGKEFDGETIFLKNTFITLAHNYKGGLKSGDKIIVRSLAYLRSHIERLPRKYKSY